MHFIECIRTGEPSRVEGDYGRHIIAVVEAAHHSLETGARVEIQS